MRSISGGLIIVAGAILWGAGAIAVTLSNGMKTSAEYGGTAIFGGFALIVVGLAVVVCDFLPGRPPPRRPPADRPP
jgi:hypothetical protein